LVAKHELIADSRWHWICHQSLSEFDANLATIYLQLYILSQLRFLLIRVLAIKKSLQKIDILKRYVTYTYELGDTTEDFSRVKLEFKKEIIAEKLNFFVYKLVITYFLTY